MIIGDMEIRLRADIARLQRDMDQARQVVGGAMANIGRAVSGAMAAVASLGVGLSVAAFASWVKGAIDAADATDELSEKTGIAHKELAGLQLIFEREGVGGDAMTASLSKLSKAVVDGNQGLSALSIKTKDASGAFRGTQAVLYDVADQFAAMDNGVQKTALAVEIFGKSGASLIPMLNGGSAGMREMAEMAQKLGLVIDEETAKKAGDFNDTLFLLQKGSQGVARGLAAELLPTLTNLAGSLLQSMTQGDALARTGQVLSASLKTLYTVGGIVVETFKTIGTVVGALAAGIVNNLRGAVEVLVRVANGDFKGAWETMKSTVATTKDIYVGAAQDIGTSWSATSATIKKAWSEEGDAAVLQAAKAAKAQEDLLANQKQREEAEKKAAAAREAAMTAAMKFADTQEQEIAQIGLTADQIKMMTAARAAALAPTEALRLKIMENALAWDIKNKAQIESTEAEKAATAAATKADEALHAATASVWDQVVAMQKQVDLFGLTEVQVLSLQRTRLEADLAAADGDEKKIAALNLQIEGMTKLIALAGQKQFLEESKKAAEETVKAQRAMWESIDKTAHDTFVSIASGGKGAAQRLKETFQNIFFDWLYQMTLKKWIFNLQGSISGTDGIVGAIQSAFSSSGSGSSGAGMFGGAANLLSIGKSIYSGFSTGLMGGLGNIVSSMGNAFGSVAMSEFGGGLAAAGTNAGAGAVGTSYGAGVSAGTYAIPIAGWIAAGMMAAKNLYAQGWDGKNGSMNNMQQGSGIMVFDSLLRGIGLSNSVANIFSGQSTLARLLGRKNPEITEQGIRGTASASGFDGEAYAKILEKGGLFRSDKNYEKTAALGADQDAGFDSTITAMIAAVKGFGAALGMETTVIDGYSKAISVTLTADEEKNKAAIAAMFGGIGDELSTLLVPNLSQFSAAGETASATLQRLVSDYQAVDLALAAIGRNGEQAFGAVGLASAAARERLIAAAGGLDALASGAAFFAQNFLTAEEQMAPVIANVNMSLADMGLAGVSTTEQFKQVVLGLDLSTQAGADQYAALLRLAPQFKQMTEYTDSLAAVQAAAAAQMAEAQAAAIQKIADANQPYLDQLREMDRATMSATEIRAQDIDGMDASTVALYDLVAARRAEISASAAAAAAIVAAQASANQAMADYVTRNYAGASAANATVQALQQQTVATDSMASGATAAAQAIEDAAARAKAVASERAGIERSMMQLQGDTAGLRKLELAALDPANRALQEQYFALQDKMEADRAAAAMAQAMAEAQARAAEESKRAAEALKAAWKGATDSIFDEVARIRGLINGGGASSLAGAQSAFAIATAQARAGDQDAAKMLPGLSRSVLELAESNATTLLDLRRIQAQTAASLIGTGTGLASQFGLQVPSYDVGTDYVPRTGLALIHEGERITPAAYNRPFTPDSGGATSAEVLAELRALRAEVVSFHRDNSNENQGIARDGKRLADGVEMVTDGFDAMRTKEEA